MKIAVILSRCSPLGPFIVARDIVNELCNRVEHIDVYYLRETKEKLKFKVPVKKIKFNIPIAFDEYDIVHSHGFVADAYLYIHSAARRAIQVTTIHQRIAPDYSMKYNRLFGAVFEYVWCKCFTKNTHIVTLTSYLLQYYSDRIRYNSIRFIYNGIAAPVHEGRLPEEEKLMIQKIRSKFSVVGLVSRLVYLKGIDQAIKCLANDKSIALIIIGSGEEQQELNNIARSYEVEDRCFFLGYKNDPAPYMSCFDVFLMPSRSEGFGLTTIEAASQKIPIVCSDLPVYSEIFGTEDICRFETENIESLNHAIQTALSNKDQLALNAYNRYKERFTAQVMGQNYLDFYKELVNKRTIKNA